MNCKSCFVILSETRASVSPFCAVCGPRLAKKSIEAKQQQVMPLFNKGGYQFAGGVFAKQNVRNCKNPMLPLEMSVGVTRCATVQSIKLPRASAIVFLPNGDRRLYREGDKIPKNSRCVMLSTGPG